MSRVSQRVPFGELGAKWCFEAGDGDGREFEVRDIRGILLLDLLEAKYNIRPWTGLRRVVSSDTLECRDERVVFFKLGGIEFAGGSKLGLLELETVERISGAVPCFGISLQLEFDAR